MSRRFLACMNEGDCTTRMQKLLDLQKKNGRRLRFLRLAPSLLTFGYMLVVFVRAFWLEEGDPQWGRAWLECATILSAQMWLAALARNVLVENEVLDAHFDHVLERNYVLNSPLGPTIVPMYVGRIDAFRFNWAAEAEAKDKGQVFVIPPKEAQ